MTRYLARKLVIYLVTFCRRGDDRLGDPALHARRPDRPAALADAGPAVVARQALTGYYTQGVRLRRPDLEAVPQLLGRALPRRPRPQHRELPDAGLGADHAARCPYTLALLVPAILLSFWAGNKVGALAARRKALDNTVLPVAYVLTATPQMWLGIVLVWVFASTLAWLPGLRRLQTSRCSRRGRSSSPAASSTTGSCRSRRSSSSPSAAGRSGCGT